MKKMKERDARMAFALIHHFGADANAKDDDGNTPLHLLVIHAHVDKLKVLIDNGADVNAQNKYGDTPLHIACRLGETVEKISFKVERLHIIDRFLNEFNADHSVKNNDGYTAFQIVIQSLFSNQKAFFMVTKTRKYTGNAWQ